MSYVLMEAIRQKDFAKAIVAITKYLSKQLKTKAFAYPVPEKFVSSGSGQMIGIKIFLLGSKAIRLNWKTNINASAGLVSMDYWDGSKTPQPYPSHHVQFDHEQSLVSVLPFIVEFLQGKVPNRGMFVNEEVAPQFQMVTDFRQKLEEATYTSGDIAKTASNIIAALKANVQIADQYKAGGNKKYGPRWDKLANEMKKQYASLFKKQGAKIIIEPTDVDKIDVDKIVKAVAGEPGTVAYTITSGSKEEVIVDGASEADADRMSYEEQLDSLKTGMKLLMSNATNAMFVGGRGGCLSADTELDIRTE